MGPSAVDAILSVCEHGRFVYGLDGLAQHFEPDWRYFGAEDVKVVAGSRSGHCSDTNSYSRYILIQIGHFSIDFERETCVMPDSQRVDLGNISLPFYIGDNLEQLRHISVVVNEHRPTNVSDSEYADLQGRSIVPARKALAAQTATHHSPSNCKR